MARDPLRDQVATAGIGQTKYARTLEGRTSLSLGMEAARRAILDAHLTERDIDGIRGIAVSPVEHLMNTPSDNIRIDMEMWRTWTERGGEPAPAREPVRTGT